jgi:hypothetical protein
LDWCEFKIIELFEKSLSHPFIFRNKQHDDIK